MPQRNIIDLNLYRDDDKIENNISIPHADNLENAIQYLIYQLRELGPLPPSTTKNTIKR
jgi:hypothetical protein